VAAERLGPLHVLVIPSEEYVPARAPLAGVFQKNQIDAIGEDPELTIGVVSVRLHHSVPMYLKALAFRLAGKRVDNELGELSAGAIVGQFRQRMERSGDNLRIDKIGGRNVVHSTGLYFLPPSPKTDYAAWIVSGHAGYRRYVAEFGKPDLIHAHNALNAGLLADTLRERYGVPYVLTEHSSYFRQGLVPKNLFPLVRRAIVHAKGHSVVSPALRRWLEESLGKLDAPSEVLPNVLPPAYEAALPARPKRGRNAYVVLSVGNLLPVKGHQHLLQAFAKFAAHHPEAILRLAGEGPLRGKLEALAVSLGVGDQVAFLGEVSSEAVRQEMLEADVLALPSQFETFGVVLIEAMACGLPIVATRCGGPESIVTEATGVLVTPGDPAALAAGLEAAFAKGDQFDRDGVRAEAIGRYGRGAFAARLKALYKKALND